MLNALNRLFVLPQSPEPTPHHHNALAALCSAMGRVGESQSAREFIERVLHQAAPEAGWQSAFVCVPRGQDWTLLQSWDPHAHLHNPKTFHIIKKLAKRLQDDPARVLSLGSIGSSSWPLADVLGQPADDEDTHGALTGLSCDGELCGVLLVIAPKAHLSPSLLQNVALGLGACLQLAMSWGQIKRDRVLLSAMFDACPDPVVLYDPTSDRLVESNQRALSQFNLQRADFASLPVMESPLSPLATALTTSLIIAPDQTDIRREVQLQGTTWDLACSSLQQAGRDLVVGILRSAAPDPLTWEEDTNEEDAHRVFVLEDEKGSAQRWVVVRQLPESDAKLPTHTTVPLKGDNLRNPLRDRLTGLVSGPLFLERVEHGLRKQRASRSDDDNLLTVLVVDLDGFHILNRTYGWQVGDAILKETALRLQAALRDTDTVCRWQDDEFIVLAEDQASTEGIWAVGERIRTVLSIPFEVDDLEIVLTASVGATTSEETARSAQHMIEDARLAMRKAKRDHQGIYMFDPAWDNVQDTQEIHGRKWTIQAD